MKRVLLVLLAAVFAAAAPALAKDFVQDQAGMFSPDLVQQLNTRLGNFTAQTGKEVVVQTVPSVAGGDVRTAALNAFAQQRVNGVLIFIDKGDRKDWIVPDQAAVQAGWWSSQTSASVASAMEAQFRAGDFDGGITAAVNETLDVYRSHLSSLPGAQSSRAASGANNAGPQQSTQGLHITTFWWIIIALFGFFIIRSIMRAAAGPRAYGGGYGPGGPGYGGPGYGYGGWGGGGGFWSGLLGGLGGAWLGNEMFGHQNVGTGAWGNTDPTGGQAPADAGGWQSDPGQANVGGGAGGDWGGGGFGGGGFGGGGGGFGGGGGDAGGGW